MSIQDKVSSWENLLEISQKNTSAEWVKRVGQSPSTAPVSGNRDQTPPILLYRDTNSWCPFCERVWFALEEKGIPFEVEFIDLRNKPKWYTDMVPTGLVPAVKIEGKLVYESKDILLALEERFGPSLLPDDPEEKAVAREALETQQTNGLLSAGYQFLRGKSSDSNSKDEAEAQLPSLQAAFETKLNELEKALAKYPGPYFMSDFGIVDIIYASGLFRFAANLPVFRGYQLLGNDRFPNLSRWFEAIEQRPAYQKVKVDSTTCNLIMTKLFGLQPNTNILSVQAKESHGIEDRMEAAAKLSDNYQAVLADVLKNSGIKALVGENSLDAIEQAVDLYLRLLTEHLISGEQQVMPGGVINGKNSRDAVTAAAGAITLAYIRNRVCVPRDMSAGAATAFRRAADKILASIY